jgi:hypothetical protein
MNQHRLCSSDCAYQQTVPQVVHGVGSQDTCPRGLLTLEQVFIFLDETSVLITFVQAVIALKRRIDAASAEFGSNIAVRAVEWHSRIHRVHGWEREISRVSLPTIPDLRQGIKDVLGDCFLLLSHRWHDVLLAEVRQNQGQRTQLFNFFSGCFSSQRCIQLFCFAVSWVYWQRQHCRALSRLLHHVGVAVSYRFYFPVTNAMATQIQVLFLFSELC